MENARHMFDEMPERNVVSWTVMIVGYSRHGHVEEAVTLFYRTQLLGTKPNQFTFSFILRVCTGLEALEFGIQIHNCIIKKGIEFVVFVESALVDMYAKCGIIENTRKVFDKMPQKNEVSWNAMIGCYAQLGYVMEALTLFNQMQWSHVRPDVFIFTSILSACGDIQALQHGKQVYVHIISSGFHANVFVGSALVDMDVKCERTEAARKVFDEMPKQNMVLWTAMIGGYDRQGQCEETSTLFSQVNRAGQKLNQFTFGSILRVCAGLQFLRQGRHFHAYLMKSGFESSTFVGNALVDMYAKCGKHSSPSTGQAGPCFHSRSGYELNVVLGNTVIDMYAKFGRIEDACIVFDKMPQPEIVSGNALIAGYGKQGCGKEAFELFGKLQWIGMKPNQVTFVSVLSICASLAVSGTSQAGDAEHMFNRMPNQDEVSWTTMIAGYGKHGYCKQALQLYEQMLHKGMMPDHINLIGVLTACSQGRLVEGYDFMSHMPFEPIVSVWGALLSACRIHVDMELGKHAAERLLELQPQSAGTCILLSNMYAAAGRWDDVAKVRIMMEKRGIKRKQGYSRIEIRNKAHAFLAGDRSHLQSDEIYAMLERLAEMKAAGYVPETTCVLHDVEE
eukprot:Gb_28288 [translate_table: standard]